LYLHTSEYVDQLTVTTVKDHCNAKHGVQQVHALVPINVTQ